MPEHRIDHVESPLVVVTGGIHYDAMFRLPRLPRANDRIGVSSATLAPGGMGGNPAAIFARLGGRVRFAGSFADDEDGRALRADLEADGVDCSFATTREGASWRGFILVGDCGDRAIIGGFDPRDELPRAQGRSPGDEHAPLANRGSGYRDLMRRLFDSEGLFDRDVVGVILPSNFAAELLQAIPDCLPIFIDVETGHLDGQPEDIVWTLIRQATIVFANEQNAQALADRLVGGNIERLTESMSGFLVQTCGERGCVVRRRGERTRFDGFRVESVDTTGAGDSFAAAFTLGHLRGWSIQQTARFANAVAALSTTALGSRSGVPDPDAVEAFLLQHG